MPKRKHQIEASGAHVAVFADEAWQLADDAHIKLRVWAEDGVTDRTTALRLYNQAIIVIVPRSDGVQPSASEIRDAIERLLLGGES